jgi:hypothetical protein
MTGGRRNGAGFLMAGFFMKGKGICVEITFDA